MICHQGFDLSFAKSNKLPLRLCELQEIQLADIVAGSRRRYVLFRSRNQPLRIQFHRLAALFHLLSCR